MEDALPTYTGRRSRSLAGSLLSIMAVAVLAATVYAQPTIDNPAPDASAPDGVYTPFTNRTIYQSIASDYMEIVNLTNRVLDGSPLPSQEILTVYEQARHARIGEQARILRDFAREPERAQEFPDAAAFYGSATFLDDLVYDAIMGTGSAANYTDLQRRQAIQKGVLRIVYHWSAHYMLLGGAQMNAGLVDEAWAIYMGLPVNGAYPNSLSATAVSREQNFNRTGTLDVPLREAMGRAQRAAANRDAAAYRAAERDTYSRFNAIFYLATLRYFNEPLTSVGQGDSQTAAAQQIEGLSFYRSIQPTVAMADSDADATIVAFFNTPPSSLTAAMRDNALAALNRNSSALLLQSSDLVTSFN